MRNPARADVAPDWSADGDARARDARAIRFHDLRHTSATLLLAAGVHGKIVQERLGQINIAMTLDLYSHVTADMQRDAAQKLEARLAPDPRTA